jgi:acetyltransferase
VIHIRTKTGLPVALRQARATDRAALLAGFVHLSDESRYARFFTAVPELSPALLNRLTDLDGELRFALAVFDPEHPTEVDPEADTGDIDPATDGLGIAVARWARNSSSDTTAELAITIIDAYQSRGLGVVLMAGLFATARRHGITKLRAEVLASNRAMIGLCHRLGGVEVPVEPHDATLHCLELDCEVGLDRAELHPSVRAALESLA